MNVITGRQTRHDQVTCVSHRIRQMIAVISSSDYGELSHRSIGSASFALNCGGRECPSEVRLLVSICTKVRRRK
jgi:hypothetical protein